MRNLVRKNASTNVTCHTESMYWLEVNLYLRSKWKVGLGAKQRKNTRLCLEGARQGAIYVQMHVYFIPSKYCV